jgi:hypothetical protein
MFQCDVLVKILSHLVTPRDIFACSTVHLLPRDVLVKIFSHLGTPRDMFTSSTVCRFFADAASEPELWHEMAVLKYGAAVADGTIHLYQGNWKSMVADDNKLGALPTLELSQSRVLILCSAEMISVHRCVVSGVQWDRQNGKVRVHLDANASGERGDGGPPDLQHPRGSTVDVRSDNGVETYGAESWNEEVGLPGHHYKGCLIFDELIFSREESSFQFNYTNFPSCGKICYMLNLLPGNLGSFQFDRYTLNGSLYEDDTPEV